MRSGDTVRDGQGNVYQVGQLLGRGAWGKSYVARRESDDAMLVLKLPLAVEDLPEKTPVSDAFLASCREALMEQARVYEQGQLPFLPKLEARFTTPDGQPAMLIPRYAESLEKRILDGATIGSLVDTLLTAAKLCRQVAASGAGGAPLHGGLSPHNILFSERGDVFLADLATPTVRKHIAVFGALSPRVYLPPELTQPQSQPPWAPVADTWALAMILWRGIMGPAAPHAWPQSGLDKTATASLKNQVLERIKSEDSNPRFHVRLAERLGVLLSRALSAEMAPSPPYRFARIDELVQRLEEITALIRPQVTAIGKVMLGNRSPSRTWFDTTESAKFSVTVGASTGVEGHEEIGVGVAVFDTSKEERLKNVALQSSVDKHPSGRYRFSFEVSDLPPANYKVRLAFAIRDSGQQPATVEGEFIVRAAPGWVPPAEPPSTQALPFQREITGLTRPASEVAAATPPAEPAHPSPAPAPAPAQAKSASAHDHLDAPEPRRVPAVMNQVRPTAPANPAPEVGLRPLAPVSRPAPAESPPSSGPAAPTRTASHGFAGASPSPPPRDPEPTPLRQPRPILPENHEPVALPLPAGSMPAGSLPAPAAVVTPLLGAAKPFATPVQPAPAATLAHDEPAFEPPRQWTYEPIPKPTQYTPPTPEDQPSALDEDDLELGPSPLQKISTALKNDPYLQVMTGLAVVITLLVLVFIAIKR